MGFTAVALVMKLMDAVTLLVEQLVVHNADTGGAGTMIMIMITDTRNIKTVI